jgi:hypothetical protein
MSIVSRRRLWVLLVAAVMIGSVTAAADASGTHREFIDQRCQPVFGFCWSTSYEDQKVDLVMESADHGGSYQVCVTAPRGGEACRSIHLHRRPDGPHGDAGFRSRVVFSKSFKSEGAGLYRVIWQGQRLNAAISPTLFFELTANGRPSRR